MAITYSLRVRGGGTDSFHGFEYFALITLASREFQVLLAVLPASLRCLHNFGFVNVAWCCDPTFFLPTLTVYYREVPLLGFRLVWCWSGVSVVFALIARTIPAPVFVLALRSAADVAIFFLNSAVFALVLGTSVLASEF